MAFIPFDRLKTQGYTVEAFKRPDHNGTQYRIKKGDFEYQHILDDWKHADDPRYIHEVETHVERAFQDAAKRKIKDMANMYNLPDDMYNQMTMGQMRDMDRKREVERHYAMRMMNLNPYEEDNAKEEAKKKQAAKEAAKKKETKKKQLILISKRKVS